MSVLTSVGILVFSMLIMAFLQLAPGIFLLFAHFVTGKYSKNKATDLITFFILGVETATVIMFLCAYAILCGSPITMFVTNDIFAWIMAGIFIALALITATMYFRKGPGSKLFLSRSFATSIRTKITTVKSRPDAFFLGFFAAVPELFFTLPLYFISALAVMNLGTTSLERAGLIIIFAFAAVAPLLIFHTLSHTRTTADFLRFRFRNKSFFRFSLSLFYLLIATLIITGVVL